MNHLHILAAASALALAAVAAAIPASAQSTGGAMPQSSGSQSSGSQSSGSQSSRPSTGALPDNSLAGQRQGTIGGGSVTQGGNSASEPPKQGSGQ